MLSSFKSKEIFEEEKKENLIVEKEKTNSSIILNRAPLEYIINIKGEMISRPSNKSSCHCGSRQKYKKCCRDNDNKRMRELYGIDIWFIFNNQMIGW